jgi:hypothetical protein
VCDQILEIEKQLDHQLQDISKDRLVEITYEGFCEDPESALRWISQQIPGVCLQQNLIASELKPFEASAKIDLTEAEQQRVLARLKKARSTMATVCPPNC